MECRLYIPGTDDLAVLRLRAKVWGADHPHTSAAFYEWLFRQTPDGPGTGIVSERDGAVVGFAGITRRSGRLGDAHLGFSHGLEFMVDPDLGGMLSGRVGAQVLKAHAILAKDEGLDFNLNYPNDSSNRMLVSNRIGYTPVLRPDLHVCATGPLHAQGGVARKLAYGMAGGMAAIYARLRGLGKGSTGVEVVSAFDARFDDHWDRLCRDGRLRFTRDAQTLTWRYRQNPLHDYTVLAVPSSDGIAGYAVVAARTILGTEAMVICDLQAADSTAKTLGTLLQAIRSTAKTAKTPLIVSQAISQGAEAQALRSAGFVRIPQRFNPKPFRMVLTSYTDLGHKALLPDNWAFAWGDMDVV